MINKTEWVSTHELGECKLRYPLVVKLELVSDEPIGSDDFWVASCDTLCRHTSAPSKEKALYLLGHLTLGDLASYRDTKYGNTENANSFLRFLEALIIEE